MFGTRGRTSVFRSHVAHELATFRCLKSWEEWDGRCRERITRECAAMDVYKVMWMMGHCRQVQRRDPRVTPRISAISFLFLPSLRLCYHRHRLTFNILHPRPRHPHPHHGLPATWSDCIHSISRDRRRIIPPLHRYGYSSPFSPFLLVSISC